MKAMRKTGLYLSLALLLVIGSFAGCFGKDDGGGGGGALPTGDGNETGTEDDPGTGPDGDGTGDNMTGDGGDEGNTTAPPAEETPDPVNTTVEFSVSGGQATSGEQSLTVMEGDWSTYDAACTVTGHMQGGWLGGGTLEILFNEEPVASDTIPADSTEPVEIALSVPAGGEAGDYVFRATSDPATSGWDVVCQVSIVY